MQTFESRRRLLWWKRFSLLGEKFFALSHYWRPLPHRHLLHCDALRAIALTCIAGTTGAPQIKPQLAHMDGLPISLSLLGARGSDKMLISFTCEVAHVLGR
jgi:hypothetical protein